MAEEDAKEIAPRQAWRGLQSLAGSISPVLQPAMVKRGLTAANLLQAWGEIVGPRYARCTLPEHIRYDRGSPDSAGILTIRVDGPMALYLQHELGELTERINAFIGRRAIRQIRVIQRPIERRTAEPRPPPAPLAEEDRAALAAALGGIEDEGLRLALRRLGEAVLGEAAALAAGR